MRKRYTVNHSEQQRSLREMCRLSHRSSKSTQRWARKGTRRSAIAKGHRQWHIILEVKKINYLLWTIQESPAVADKPARRERVPKLLQFDVLQRCR